MTTTPSVVPGAGTLPERRGAGVGIRAVATVIDLILLFIVFYVVDAACGADAPGLMVTGLPALFLFLLDFLYYVGFEGAMQATPGKLVTGLRVVRVEDGGPIGYGRAAVRTVLRIVDAFPYVAPYLLAAIIVGVLKKNQRVGDMAARTLVVRKETAR